MSWSGLLKHLRCSDVRDARLNYVIRWDGYLEVIQLHGVEYSVLVCVAEFEDTFQGCDTRGFEDLNRDER